MEYVAFPLFLSVLLEVCFAATTNGVSTYRKLYERVADHRLSSVVGRQLMNASVESCASYCIRETDFECKSFDFDNTRKACLLFSVSVDDPDVNLIAMSGRDHYKTAYTKLFHRLANHMLTLSHNRRIDGLSVEQCARRCILENYFKCRGFDFEVVSSTCWLTELTPERAKGVNIIEGWDYYEKSPEGPLDMFVSYGFGQMKQLRDNEVYNKFVMGVPLEACATLCLAEQTFHCISFDYVFDRDDKSVCYLSKYIAAHVYGLEASPLKRAMHFERKEIYLSYFYPTPYAVVLGNNHKTYSQVTPNRCARMCLEEEAFVCRSFDYKIQDGTCLLSSKTGSDVGGLYNQGLAGVHHFEMKPILDCGGNLTETTGDFASPNWPRNYAHHETCIWNITIPKHRVIRIKFTHLDLGLQFHNPCDVREDRVVITEHVTTGPGVFCVLPNTKLFTTRSNTALVSFTSNAHTDGQGFRAFYTAEWPCDVSLTSAPGEFASPNHPDNYPPNTRCSWRITAPQGMRVRVRFTTFKLEEHSLGHCNENFDHLVILDGGTVGAPKIGLYCGSYEPFTVRSTARDLFIQFKSDPNYVRPGFHAFFDFETANGTLADTSGIIEEEFTPLETDASETNVVGKPGVEKRLQSEEEKAKESSGVDPHHHYKTTMWAIITTLLLLLLVTAVAIYVMWNRYRGHFGGQREAVREDSEAPEEVPLHMAACNHNVTSKCNNDSLHGNEIDLAGASGKDTSAYTNLLYGEAPPKYHTKLNNANLDSKC